MRFESGDIVQYVGHKIAEKLSRNSVSVWGSLDHEKGEMGVILFKLGDVTGIDDKPLIRYMVRIPARGRFDHLEEVFYEFELEKT